MRVFLCHSSKDKPIAIELARVLVRNQVRPYLDIWEFKGGESLVERISGAIVRESDFLIAIISRNSIHSSWVRQELRYAMTREIEHGSTFVIPILADECPVPDILSGKLYIPYRTGDAEAERKLLVALGLDHALPPGMQYLWYLAQWERSGVLPEDEFFRVFDQQLGVLAEETNSKEFVFRALVRNFSPDKQWFVNLFTEDEFIALADRILGDAKLDEAQRHREKTDRESIVRLAYLAALQWKSWKLGAWLCDTLRAEKRPAVRNASVECLLRLAADFLPARSDADRQESQKLAARVLATVEATHELIKNERYRHSQLEKLLTVVGRLGLESPEIGARLRELAEGPLGHYPLYGLTFWSDPESRGLIVQKLEQAASAEEATWLAKLCSGQITGRFIPEALPLFPSLARPEWTEAAKKRLRAMGEVLEQRTQAQARRGIAPG
jgi:hypothetical protein